MGCRKAFEVDLPAFLAEATRPEFAEFREHYPQCRDCSAEVRAWTEVHLLLVAGGPGADAHPTEERLLQFEENPEALPAAPRKSIEEHLARCRSCTDELATLRAMDLASLEAAVGGAERGPVAPEPAEWRAERRERAPEAVRRRPSAPARLLSCVRGLALHPAFAYALVLLVLLYPAVKGLLEDSARVPVRPATPATVGVTPQASREADRRDARLEERRERFSAGELKPAPAPADRKELVRGERASRREAGPVASRAPMASRAQAGGVADRRADEGPMSATENGAAEPPPALAPGAATRDRVSRDAAERAASSELQGVGRQERAATFAAAPPFTGVLALRQGEPVEIPQAVLRGLLTVRVVLPDAAREAAEVEVRVFDPEGRREVRERARPSPALPHLDVRLPADWLRPGAYRVELFTIDAGASAPRVFEFAFTVR